MNDPDEILCAAETVVGVLARHRVKAVVIGAVALAAYRYVRQTDDVDLGVNASVTTLRSVMGDLRELGYKVELREPDGTDPLGGVLDVVGTFGLIQIVSFAGRFPAVIDDAVMTSSLPVREGSQLRLVPLPQLIALKLYAGGYKSHGDIVELLARNPDADLQMIRAVCERYRLTGIDNLIAEAATIAPRKPNDSRNTI